MAFIDDRSERHRPPLRTETDRNGAVGEQLLHARDGDIRRGEGSTIGQCSAIHADEGTLIVIGRRACIQSRVTFHALKGSSVAVGNTAQIGNGIVVHGPVTIGDNVISADDCVDFQSTVENNGTVRSGATVAAAFVLREGTIVPEAPWSPLRRRPASCQFADRRELAGLRPTPVS